MGREVLVVLLTIALTRAAAASPPNADQGPAEIHDRPPQRPAVLANQAPQSDDPTLLLERMQNAFAAVAERVAPAVVAIYADPKADAAGKGRDWAPDASVATGTGVIIRQDGMILTSQHVIDDAAAIYATLYDGRRFKAKPLAADRRADLAVVQIDATGLATAEFGDAADLRCGHFVLAIGNSLGLSDDGRLAVSQGVVSALGRPLPDSLGREQDRYYGDMIQTTALIGPGNSGGPLVDIHGRVVGLVTAQCAVAGAGKGFGFAVPIGPRTRGIVGRLLEGGLVDYGYVGIEVGRLDDQRARAAGLPAARGALADSVLPGGPAALAGLHDGDIIVTLDGLAVQSPDHFVQLVGAAGPEREIEVGFLRGSSERQTAKVRLARRTPPGPQVRDGRTISFRGAALDQAGPSTRSLANLPATAFIVLVVNTGSPADRAGLTPGDIVVRLNGELLSPDSAARLAELRGDALLGLANGGSVLVKTK